MDDSDLVSIAREFRQGILGERASIGMCKVVSAPLQGFLASVYGVETELVEVDFGTTNHVYLRLPDGRILDATADQFSGMPDVYLGPVPALYEQMTVSQPVERHGCEIEGCESSAQGYWLPDSDQDGEPDSYLCTEHAHAAGWCWGCGGFWCGVESFDFGSKTGLCENCEPGFLSEMGEGEDWAWEEGDYYWDDPDGELAGLSV